MPLQEELAGSSSQHPLQLLDPLQDLLFDRPQFRQDLQRWAVLHHFVDQFLVTNLARATITCNHC